MITSLIKKVTVIIISFAVAQKATSQIIPTDSALIQLFESDKLLPILIDSAIKNSPVIRRSERGIELLEENTKTNKKTLLNGISFLSSYNYGTTGDLTIGKEGVVGGQFSNFSSTKSDRYNLGLNLQIPLTSIINRKNLLKTSRLQEQMAEADKEISIINVKQEVIRLYLDLKLSQKVLLNSSKTKQIAFVNFSLAEKEFLHGDGNIEQFTRMQDAYSKATIEYDSNVNRFQNAYLQLETFTKIHLSNLIRKLR